MKESIYSFGIMYGKIDRMRVYNMLCWIFSLLILITIFEISRSVCFSLGILNYDGTQVVRAL